MLNRLKPKSEFAKNVLTLMTGTTIAQAIPIAISPILTRLYSPKDFGVFALFVAISSIFGSIANGRYELAIMLPRKDEDAINIFALGFIITSFISLILLVLAILFNDYFTELLNNKEISMWLYFVPVTVFFTGIWNILNYFNNRKKQYKDLAKATVIKSIVTAIIQLSIGFIRQGAIGLISGQIVSQFFSNTKLLQNIIKDKILLSKISKLKIIAMAKRYKDFPKYDFLSTLFSVTSVQIGNILFNVIFTATVAGYYFFINKILNLPIILISRSVGDVYKQEAAKAYKKNKNFKNIFFITFKKLFLFSFLPFTFFYFYSVEIITFLFGIEWRTSGELAKILTPMLFLRFIVSPLTFSFYIVEKQYINLIGQSFLFFSILFSFYLGYLYNSYYYTVIFISISYSIFYIINFFIAYRLSNNFSEDV